MREVPLVNDDLDFYDGILVGWFLPPSPGPWWFVAAMVCVLVLAWVLL